ncbi:MAG: hypothetical protein JXP36_03680 [Bacteroidales bacterium]|nr:hypothetical protein [Bacteroidales bacterium]
MKTILSFIFIAILSGNIYAQKSALLKYNLEPGKTYKAKAVSVQDQKTTMQGMERNTEISNTIYFSMKSLSAKDDFFMAEVHFDTIVNSTSMPQMVINSAKPGNIKSQDPVEVMQCILNRYSNTALVVQMDYTGHVKEILNYNVITENVLSGLDSLTGQAMMAKAQIELMMNKDAIKGMIESITATLPNQEVKKNDIWESKVVNAAGGIGMEIISTNKINDIADNKASITADIIVEPAVSDKPMVMNGAEISTEIRGLGKGESEIDITTGWVISSSSTTQLKGNMNVKMPGQEMQIPMEIKISTETIAID